MASPSLPTRYRAIPIDRNDNDNRNAGNAPNDDSSDLLVPPAHDTTLRQSTVTVAIFNLIATIVGGGVLSLPLAFERLGVGWATLFMMGAAVTTAASLYLLCLSARFTGATS